MLSLGAEFIANDKPLLVKYDGACTFQSSSASQKPRLAVSFQLQANYKSPYIKELIAKRGVDAVANHSI